MITHEDLWRAIDRLAANNGLSASGMAKKAGLHESTFNPSKRISATGRPRWPTFEILNKAMEATNTSINEFARLVDIESAR